MSRESVRGLVTEKPERKPPIPDSAWLSLGCGLANLAVSGRVDRGIAMGNYVWFVGDSESGKSWMCLQILAEAAKNPNFKNHRLIYDPVENGVLLDVPQYFGKELARRLEPPNGTQKKPQPSRNVQEFYFNLRKLKKEGNPFIYILDSMDSLDEKSEEEKFDENMDKYEKGKDTKGSFSMTKQKFNSQNINRVVTGLADTNSILIIISQTRDKVNSHIPNQKTAGGGRALKFYSHVQIWTSIKGDLKRTVMKKERVFGKQILFDVQKNRISGRDVKVDIPYLWDYGFDDIGACVDYLVDEEHWSKTGSTIKAKEFGVDKKREDLIAYIEDGERRVDKLRSIVQITWRKIAEETKIKRKPRYV